MNTDISENSYFGISLTSRNWASLCVESKPSHLHAHKRPEKYV